MENIAKKILFIAFLIFNLQGCKKIKFEKSNLILGKWEPFYENKSSYKSNYYIEFLSDGTFRNFNYTLNKIVGIAPYEIDEYYIYINLGEGYGITKYKYHFLEKKSKLMLKPMFEHFISITEPTTIIHRRIK